MTRPASPRAAANECEHMGPRKCRRGQTHDDWAGCRAEMLLDPDGWCAACKRAEAAYRRSAAYRRAILAGATK